MLDAGQSWGHNAVEAPPIGQSPHDASEQRTAARNDRADSTRSGPASDDVAVKPDTRWARPPRPPRPLGGSEGRRYHAVRSQERSETTTGVPQNPLEVNHVPSLHTPGAGPTVALPSPDAPPSARKPRGWRAHAHIDAHIHAHIDAHIHAHAQSDHRAAATVAVARRPTAVPISYLPAPLPSLVGGDRTGRHPPATSLSFVITYNGT